MQDIILVFMELNFNSYPPGAAYMHQWIGSAYVVSDNGLAPNRRQAII